MQQQGTKIYVGNLSWNTTEGSLSEAFSKYGNIIEALVMLDRETGRSRGFGFVTYESEKEAEAAIAKMHDGDLDGRRIRVSIASTRGAGGGDRGGGRDYGGQSRHRNDGYGGGGGGYGGYSGGGGQW